MNIQNITFDVGGVVPENGTYVCVPCGFKKKFKSGDIFPRCFSCLQKKKYEGDDYFKDLGLWELIS